MLSNQAFFCFGSEGRELRAGSRTGWNSRHPLTLGAEASFEKTKGKLVNGWSEEGARSLNSLRYLQLPFRQGEEELHLQEGRRG